MFLAGCHPVFANVGMEGMTISPNYPGDSPFEALENYSAIKRALFLQGCGGDINPGVHRPPGNGA